MNWPKGIAFFDSLIAEDAQEARWPSIQCPEPMILWSLTQEELSGTPLVEELRKHMESCSTCADLSRRLKAFHSQTQTESLEEQTAGWASVEPRLMRRVRKFLDSQPKHRPKRLFLQFPNLRWALPLTLAGTVAAAAVITIVMTRHEISSTSHTSGNRAAGARQSGTGTNAPSRSPDNQPALLSDGKTTPIGVTAGRPLEILSLVRGESLSLLLTEVDKRSDGVYRFAGRLTAGHSLRSEDSFESADVTGVWTEKQDNVGVSATMLEITARNIRYRSASENRDLAGAERQLSAVVGQNNQAPPQVGQTVEVRVAQDEPQK